MDQHPEGSALDARRGRSRLHPTWLSAVLAAVVFGFTYSAEGRPPLDRAPVCSSRSGDGCVCLTRARAIDLLAERRADEEVPAAKCADAGPDPTWSALAAALGALVAAVVAWLL